MQYNFALNCSFLQNILNLCLWVMIRLDLRKLLNFFNHYQLHNILYLLFPGGDTSIISVTTNAASEWSFSSLRRIKTYLRSTMTQSRLNSIMLLQVHDVANDFVDNKLDHRSTIFGRFTELKFNNICVCSSCSSDNTIIAI